jgi:hypothetical protein
MIYGKVREKMEKVLPYFLFAFNPNDKKLIMVYTESFSKITPNIKPFFVQNAVNNTFEYEQQVYSEDEFCRLLDLLVFT